MLLSLRWLSRYVDLSDLDATRIADDLTMATAEVDGLEVSGEALREIVVGHVVECGKHPDADKLSLTKIDDGSGELLQSCFSPADLAARPEERQPRKGQRGFDRAEPARPLASFTPLPASLRGAIRRLEDTRAKTGFAGLVPVRVES